jgi:hypothetical protein
MVRSPHLTERIRLLERRLRQALPEELTDDDRAALEELLETMRELRRPTRSGPVESGPDRSGS